MRCVGIRVVPVLFLLYFSREILEGRLNQLPKSSSPCALKNHRFGVRFATIWMAQPVAATFAWDSPIQYMELQATSSYTGNTTSSQSQVPTISRLLARFAVVNYVLCRNTKLSTTAKKTHGFGLDGTNSVTANGLPKTQLQALQYCSLQYRFVKREGSGHTAACGKCRMLLNVALVHHADICRLRWTSLAAIQQEKEKPK